MIGRTVLVTPAHIPGMINVTVAVFADSILFDLADSVPAEEKDAARILLREALKSLDFLKEKNIIIRVNDPATDLFNADIEEIVPLGSYPLVLPWVSVDSISAAERKLQKIESRFGLGYQVAVIPTLATSQGIESIDKLLKSSRRITGVFLDAKELKGTQLREARSGIAAACHAAGVEVLDTPFNDVEDVAGLRKETMQARQLGFTGKIAIHPLQVETIQEVFTSSQEK